jgi:hypothetical protein
MRTKLGTLLLATIAMMDGYNKRPYAVHSKKHNQKDPRKYFDIEGTMVFAMNKQEAKKKFLKGLTK